MRLSSCWWISSHQLGVWALWLKPNGAGLYHNYKTINPTYTNFLKKSYWKRPPQQLCPDLMNSQQIWSATDNKSTQTFQFISIASLISCPSVPSKSRDQLLSLKIELSLDQYQNHPVVLQLNLMLTSTWVQPDGKSSGSREEQAEVTDKSQKFTFFPSSSAPTMKTEHLAHRD